MPTRQDEIEKLAALTLAPLVEVAWADGRVTMAERQGVLQAAQEIGLSQHTEFCRTTLMRWLHASPPTEALERWRRLLAPVLTASESRTARKSARRLLDEAEKIARTDERSYIEGGPILSGITESEQRVLDELAAALAEVSEVDDSDR